MNTSNSPVSPSTTQRREKAIEVSLRDLEQFFNTIDPSPFHEKDLDHDLEEFIVSWATEYQISEPIRLVVHLQMILPDTDSHAVIERAVHNYFAYKADLNHREFRNLLREGRISLFIGLSFLAFAPLEARAVRRTIGTLFPRDSGSDAFEGAQFASGRSMVESLAWRSVAPGRWRAASTL